METLIKGHGCDYLIFRLPQVVGATANRHTLTNFIRDRLVSGERFTVWANASRTIVDVHDVRILSDHFIADPSIRNRIIDIYPPISMSALELVRTMERVLDLKGDYEIANVGSSLNLDAPEIVQAAAACGVRFNSEYPEQVLRKYYGRG